VSLQPDNLNHTNLHRRGADNDWIDEHRFKTLNTYVTTSFRGPRSAELGSRTFIELGLCELSGFDIFHIAESFRVGGFFLNALLGRRQSSDGRIIIFLNSTRTLRRLAREHLHLLLHSRRH
jgi:hypothetical protein